jgi:hypothetical protein
VILASSYLGIKVSQHDGGIKLCQSAYAKKILEMVGMLNCNPTATPMETWLKLSQNSTTDEVNTTAYRRLIGSLRYLVHTRSDITFTVGYLRRFMECPTVEHMGVVKRLLPYIAGTLTYTFKYKCGAGEAKLVGYSDSNHTGEQSMTQRIVALSSCEAKYVAAATAVTQAIWLAWLVCLGTQQKSSLP